MADMIRTAHYFKVQVPDKPGEGALMLGVLGDAGINLLAFSGFPRNRRAQLDFVVSDPTVFKQVAKQAKWKVQGPKACFVVDGDDRPGATADVLAKLAGAKINVTAIDAVCSGQGRFGALFWVKPRDVKKAAKALGVG
ncbi:MAG: ACT domain-containing protein [Nitrospirota bacterium]